MDSILKAERNEPLVQSNKDDDTIHCERLNRIFDKIIANVSIDFTSQEIQDIQMAINIMLERIVAKVNDRGKFKIARIQPVGSMADKTSIWKFDKEREEHFLEFDNLAVLENYVQYYSHMEEKCAGCIELTNAPVKLKRLTQPYFICNQYSSEYILETGLFNELFLNEINKCLSLLCDCLSITFHKRFLQYQQIKFQDNAAKCEHGGDRCTIDMPTGTLSVSTSIFVDRSCFNSGPSKCSLVFLWLSKVHSLSAPDRRFLNELQQIDTLPIYVDFLPALESMKPLTSGEGYGHEYFIVPKRCNTGINCKGWRKSWCMDEIKAFNNGESKTHKKCYQIIKYILEKSETVTTWVKGISIEHYDVKTVIVKHCLACSNSSDNCLECVIEILKELLIAYNLGKLENFGESTSKFNILSHHKYCDITKFYFIKLIEIMRSLGIEDTLETFIQRLTEMKFPSSGT